MPTTSLLPLPTRNGNADDALRDASFVRVHYVDLSGVMHAYILPKAQYLKVMAGEYHLEDRFIFKPIKAMMKFLRPLDIPLVLTPDMTSLRPVGQTNGRHVSVMCDSNPEGPADTVAAWKGCPRQLLRNAVRDVETMLDVDIIIGFELEFAYVDPEINALDPPNPFPNDPIGGWATMRGLRAKTLDILEKVVEALEASGVPVWRFHSEMRYQIEMSLAPASAVEAVDRLYNAREIIRACYAREGLTITMLPQPFIDSQIPHNGCHMHFSLNPRSGSSSVSDAPNETCDHFLAGILAHMKAIWAVGMPLPESSARRYGDGAGQWIGWGIENRTLPVRPVKSNRWEMRCLDSTANAYLFAATVLRAGLRGVASAMPLLHKNLVALPGVPETDAMRAAAGITERTPDSIEAALVALGPDHPGANELRNDLGEFLVDQYVDMKKRDAQELSSMTFAARRDLYIATLE